MSLFSRRSAPPAAPDSEAAESGPADRATADLPALTDATFMDATEGGWTIVDFWATWCAPCRTFSPTFAEAARRHGDRIRFAKLDVDAAQQSAALVGVQSIPTVVVFGPDGSEVTRASGVLRPADLERLIAQIPLG